ncbi:phage tail spike protein [Staphylococcus haemolyticus]|uniref:phage tail spike protein n=1 Tax=Staphylococcus haemolyticus TaxID=1283 RepID=UPI0027FA72A7|nr:phage tail spike protein [Staphylococcus haemolyticus]MDQ7223749.1 phage tail spike protein [Staphylococcus haemolyticus]
MKNVGIHVLDFNDNIIDFISQSDGALINAEMSMNVEEKTETFDFTIENTRAEKLRERNRIIAQDNNGTFREFIIIHIIDNFDGTTEIECNASYLEDLKTAKPIKPGKFEAHTTTQALLKTLADTGWEVSDDTEYSGNRTTSWTSHTNPFDLIYMLCTTYDMVPSFYIELGAHTVEHRYVSITKPKNLFKGKEITKGKDLTGMTRTIDLSEVKTALLAVGPEKEGGSRIETVVVDDEAQEIFGLPNRYIWDVYEPESNDENMTFKRLTTLAKTELNKRNQAAISYEVSSIDIHKYYNDVTVHLRDIVRVKDRDFRPPLYIEAEVIGIKYNWLADESEFTFGNVVEYEETKLREFFTRKLDEITKKLNDNISNVNTIVSDVVAGELEYYERKIFKGTEPPENPQNDTLWYDTSNPNVAVLRRYWNGKWITQTADDVEKIGGLRREQVMYRDLNNSFINLTIQHSNLQNDVYDMLNNEYLVDDDLKANLNQALSDVDSVYQNIKTNLDGMDEDTATIGKLVDTQTLFTVYREKLQTLYKYVTDAKISIDKRLKLLQSQYTDEKFNDAMDKIAQTLPNGRWDSENQQLYADIPNEQELSNLKQTLQDYYDGNIKELEGRLNNSVDSKVKVAKEEISTSVKSVESKVDGLNIGTRNLLLNTEERSDSIINSTHAYITYFLTQPLEVGEDYTITSEVYTTSSEQSGKVSIRGYFPDNGLINVPIIDNKIKLTFKAKVPSERILLYKDIAGQSSNELDTTFKNTILVKGNKIGDYAQAPEDLQRQTQQAQQDAENAAKAYADAQDNLKETQLKAYADGKVSDEEKRAIADAIAKRDEAKEYAEQKAQEAQEAANQNTSNVIKPITTRVTKNETNISELDKQISLMAKSDDVAQKLKKVDNRLTPLETDVKRNKATLNILPTQIEGKVSKQDYTLDKNNIVKRLDNADSERRQLSNEITDKVTITKFESGMADAKNYTDNQVNNLSIGGRNLLADTSGPFTENSYLIKEFPIIDKLEPGDIVTISIKGDLGDNRTAFLIYNTNAMVKIGDLNNSDKNNNDVFIKTFEWVDERRDGSNKVDSSSLRIYQYPNSATSFSTIEWIKLEKGNKATDWTPANEDVKEDIQQAETNAKAYTDAYKKSNEVAMTKLETSVSQLDGKISIKVDEQKFNASRKTLSQVISEISATTKGINLSYDENGNIQSYTMDRNGIQLRGDKVDITVNKDFNVMASRVDNKVGKDEVINRLNLSPEGLDIDVNKVGIRGGDSTNYIYLSQDKIEMAGTFQRTFRGNTQKDNVFMRAQGGFLRFRNNNQNRSLYYSDFGISTYIDGDSSEASGTLQFFDYTYSPTNSVRGVTLNSAGGAIALNSERNRIVLDANATVNIESETSSVYIRPMKNNRAGTNEFRFWTKLNDSVADTDGVLSYGTITELVEKAPASYSFGSGIRFDKSPKSRYIYATDKDGNIGTGDFYARNLLGDWWAKNNNLYALVDPKEGKLRITDYNGYNNGSPKYKDLQCDDIQANSVRVNTGQNFYIGVSTNELWVTNNLRYNGGNTGFKPVRASDFIKASSAEFKHDIKKWDYDALNVISNELQLYSYKYNDDEKQTIHHGPVIGDGYDIPVEFVFNSGVNTNEMLSWALRAIQQLNEKINKLEEQLNEQQITS